jgi:hypothetical protein
LKYELKFHNPDVGFRASGLMLFTSNKPVFQLDEQGIDRKRIPVVLNRVNIEYNEIALDFGSDGSLIGTLAQDIPKLLGY